ncbi:MAG: DUF2812 domain-containing protein [Bacillus sp. (in: Bacteria)]|nr:DUF2812 domain-containing protein [Bacillus sp. (in: firmicutes)]
MATKGWKLIEVKNLIAVFEQSEPENINFRCDIFKPTNKEERIEFYEESGWEYIGSRHYVHIFRQVDQGKSEDHDLHTDPLELAESLSILKSSIKTRAFIVFFLTIIVGLLSYFMLSNYPIGNYLQNDFVMPVMNLIMVVSVCILMINGIIHLSKLMKKLKSGNMLERGVRYKRKLWTQQIAGITLTTIITIGVIVTFWNLYNTVTDDRFPPIPDRELPVITMEDVLGEEVEYTVSEELNLLDMDIRQNYFRESSSILVPRQYKLRQDVEVLDQEWEDSRSGKYSPTLHSSLYEARTAGLASNLVKHLKDMYDYSHPTGYERYVSDNWDELWIMEGLFNDSHASTFIGRKGNEVYRVFYMGNEPIAEIIALTVKKR